MLVFVVDISERKQAESAQQQARAELAHAMRVATPGELAASIAHEVNQPLMAVVTNAEAGLRWLRRDQPELSEVESAVSASSRKGIAQATLSVAFAVSGKSPFATRR